MSDQDYENTIGHLDDRISELKQELKALRVAAKDARDLLWRMQTGQVLEYNKAEIAKVIRSLKQGEAK